MYKYHLFYLLFLFCAGGMLMSGCSKSDDQREFEREALSEPQNITSTESNGNIVNTDPDDWRISPMYEGLITIGLPGEDKRPYPNPLLFNDDLTIEIYIRGIEVLDKLEISTFEFPNERLPTIDVRDISSTGLEVIELSSELISGSSGGSGASGLYRIIIYDGQQNVVTYGDVQIGSSDIEDGS